MSATNVKDSTEHGWLTITRADYENKRRRDLAGPGTPLHPEAPGHWAMTHEPGTGTVLYTGITIDEAA